MPRRRTAMIVLCTLLAVSLAGCGHTSGAMTGGTLSLAPSGPPSPASSASPSPKPTGTPLPKPAPIPMWPKTDDIRHIHGPDGSMGSTGTRSVALTFDDGPGPYTSQILDVLDANHVKATFCLIGRQIHAYQSVVRRMIADGMTLCNHSWNHDEKLGGKSITTIEKNLARTNNAIHAINPKARIGYFRQPAGNFTKVDVAVSESLGMRPLYWAVDTRDWTRPGTAAILKALNNDTHRGFIVLMHDAGGDRSQTVAALKAILPVFKSRYTLIPLPTAIHPS